MATAVAQPAVADDAQPYRWLILIGLVTAAIMEVLDTTIVNVALPQMMGNLGATPDEIGWVSTGYILSNVVVLPMTAFLQMRFGRKRYLSFSILLFIFASFFCGTSRTLGELVFWRVIQGSGGAALLSTGQAALREIFPKEQQGLVQALFGLGIVVAPTVAPALGGWITDNYTWPWVFFVNLPIGAISFFLVSTFLTDSKYSSPHRTGSIDWAGIGLLALGLATLQYVLEEGKRYDWFSDPVITWFSVISALALALFFYWELHPSNQSPVVNLRVLKNRDLATAIVLFLVLGFGLYGGVFIFPMFVQNILGFTPTVTGLVLLPGGLATGVSMILCGQLLNGKKRLIDPRLLIVFGVVMFTISMWQLGHMTTQSGEEDTRIALILRGFGLGFLFIPINVAAFNSLKGPEIAQGSGLLNLMRQLGGSLGIAALNTYIQTMSALHRTDLTGSSGLYSGTDVGGPASGRIEGTMHTLINQGFSPDAAHQAAVGLIDRAINIQAQTQSYNDAFLLLGATFVLASPLILLLKPPPKKPAAAPVEMH